MIVKLHLQRLTATPGPRARLCFLVCLLICLVGFPLTAMAAEVRLAPFIRVQETYDNNVTFARTNEQDDYVTSLNPGLKLDYATEVLNLKSDAAVNILRYVEDSDLNTENYRFGLSAGYHYTDRYTLSGNLSYLRDTTLDSELEETGLVNVREDRERYNGGVGLSCRISERSDMGIDYTYMKTDYDAAGLVDYASDSLVLSYSRRLENQRDLFTVQPNYSQYDSDTSKVDNYGLSFGWSRAFSETMRASAFLGARYTRIEQTIPDGSGWVVNDESETDTTWGGVADISFAKTGEVHSETIGYSRDLYYSSEGQPIETDRIYVTANRMVTERFGLGFSGSLYFTESEGEFRTKDARHFKLTPSLNYKLTEHHWLRIAYSYSQHYDKTVSHDKRYDRHRAWILVHFKFPERWWP